VEARGADVSTLATAAIGLLVGAAIFGVLSAIVIRAVFDMGVRAVVQRRWIEAWLSARQDAKPSTLGPSVADALRQIDALGAARSIYALDYRQVCAQITNAVQVELTVPELSPLAKFFAAPDAVAPPSPTT
jgi:hypothetical protein